MAQQSKDKDSIPFENILNVLHEGYILVDENANIKDVNPAYCKMMGYEREELLKMNLHDVRPAMSLEYQRNFIAKAVQEKSVEFETEHRRKDGSMVNLRATAAAIEQNGITYLAGFVRNITDEKKAQEKLKASEQKWQHLVQENPQPVQVTIDGEIVFLNDAGAQLYGAEDAGQIIGMSAFEFSHSDFLENIEERKRRLENDLPVNNVHEHKIKRLDGEIRYVEVNSIPIQFQGEQAIQTVLFDVTERKEQEALIEESLQEKEVLLKEIHHRVKNNMAVISGLLELQAMNAGDETLSGLLKESQLRIHSMAMVHEKLYETEHFADLGFDEYVKELVENIEQTVEVSTKNISVRFDLKSVNLNMTKAIPAALIVNEAVVNCFKHGFSQNTHSEGMVEILIDEKDDRVTIIIRDNGVGLPQEVLDGQQKGLGLNLIKTLTAQLDGTLSMKSDNGALLQIQFEKED